MATLTPKVKLISHLPSPSTTVLSRHAMKDYVYFSDNTKGINGKAVKIKIDLFPQFAALVDPKTHVGQTIIRQIENLRLTNSGSPGVHVNVNCAFRFMLKTPNMKIFYAVLDGATGKEVFIGDIRADFDKGNDKAGLYTMDAYTNKLKWCKQADLSQKAIYVNGQCDGLALALKAARSRIGSYIDMALFYIPSAVINDLGVWNAAPTSQRVQNVTSLLADVIKFNAKNKVYWVLEAEGSDAFSNALDKVNGPVTGHRFNVIDPLTDTPLLLKKLAEKEIRPTIDEQAPVRYTGENRATNISMESHRQAIINALKVLKVKNFAEDPHRDAIAELESDAGQTPVAKNKQALINVSLLNNTVRHPKAASTVSNSAAPSFISALKRV